MARLKNLTRVREIIDVWKTQNKLEKNQRYTKVQMEDLEKKLAGYIADVIKTKDGSVKAVYYSYHIVMYILDYLDDSFTYEYEVVDYNDSFNRTQNPNGNITGLSIKTKYTSKLFKEQKFSVPLTIMDSKFDTLVNIGANDIDFTIQRSLVKNVGESIGFGYLCWLNPSWVVEEMNNNLRGKETSGLLNQQQPQEAKPQPTPIVTEKVKAVADNGMINNVVSPSQDVVDNLLKEIGDVEETFEDLMSPAVKQQEPQLDRQELYNKFIISVQGENKERKQAYVTQWFANKQRALNLDSLTAQELKDFLDVFEKGAY